jgi:hypothetical protein
MTTREAKAKAKVKVKVKVKANVKANAKANAGSSAALRNGKAKGGGGCHAEESRSLHCVSHEAVMLWSR